LIKNLLVQIVIFTAIFQFLSWFKESDMLTRNTSLAEQSFVLTSTVDEYVSLQANQKTKVIYFFAPWCHVCHASISNLQAIYQKNENIDVVAVALDFVDKAEIEQFVIQHHLTFPVVFGNEQVKSAYKISAYPSYYVINEENTVVSKSMGYSSELGLYLRSL